MHKLKIYSLSLGTNAYYCSGLYSVSWQVLAFVLGNCRLSKTAVGLASCSSVASRYVKDALCWEVWINGKYNMFFVAFSVWSIFIAVRAGSFMNRVRLCVVLTRSILSSHAACDHLVCVGLHNECEDCYHTEDCKCDKVPIWSLFTSGCNPARAEKWIHDSARYRDSGSDAVQLCSLWSYRFLECLHLVVLWGRQSPGCCLLYPAVSGTYQW